MKLQLLSFNGNNFDPNYNAFIIYPKKLRSSANPLYLERASTFPAYVGKTFTGWTLTIQIKYVGVLPDDVHVKEAEIARWFNTLEKSPKKLLAQDIADSNRQWFVMATPLEIIQAEDSAIIQLALEEPYWSVNTKSTSSWAITATGQTKDISCIGEIANPVLKIKPTGAKASGNYAYFRFVPIIYRHPMPLENYPYNLGPINSATLVSGGKAQADGDDFLLRLGGVIIPRWFGVNSPKNFNQTTTNVWVVLDFKPGIYMNSEDLFSAIANETTTTKISFKKTTQNSIKAFQRLPNAGILRLKASPSDYEYITYTSKDPINFELKGITRGAKNTTPRAWNPTSGSIDWELDWIQHDLWNIYGNSSATYPVLDESRKPIIDLDDSTNSRWVYKEFMEEGKPRAGSWKKSLFNTDLNQSTPFTGDQEANANPATDAGLKMATGNVSGIEKPENASLCWTLFIPSGIYQMVSIAGKVYRFSTEFPAVSIQKSKDSSVFETAGSIASPGSANTWAAFSTPANLVLGTSMTAPDGYGLVPTIYYMRILQSGYLSALAGNKAAVQTQTITIDLMSGFVPTMTLDTENSSYYLNTVITSVTTGKKINLALSMKLNETLIVDSALRKVTLPDGKSGLSVLSLDTERVDWLDFLYGTNQLKFDDTGTTGVTVDIEWVDKVPV